MTPRPRDSNAPKLWRASDFHDLELLRVRLLDHSFPRHRHETYVIAVLERETGASCSFYCSGASYEVPPGSIFLINPGEVHAGVTNGGTAFSYRSFYPSPRFLDHVVSQFDDDYTGGTPHFSTRIIHDDALTRALWEAHAALEDERDPVLGRRLFIEALSSLIRCYADRDAAAQSIEEGKSSVAKTRRFMMAHFAGPITLQQLADVSGLSAYHLVRVFRNEMGMAPYEFLTNMRIERARELLLDGRPIPEVVYETGFYDQSHLSRHFKRIVGVTPGQCRSRMTERG